MLFGCTQDAGRVIAHAARVASTSSCRSHWSRPHRRLSSYPGMASSSAVAAQAPSNIRDQLVDLCRVSKNIGRGEERDLHQLVEVLKLHLRNKCMSLLRSAQGCPVLWSYSSDATPLKCSATQVASAEGASVVRKGKVLHEFLVQRGCLKAKDGTGELKLAFLFSDTVPLSKGKKAWNLFSAGAAYFPLLRKAGHQGICVQHHSADRAAFEALDRCFRQRHQAYYTPSIGPELGEGALLLELTDWIVGTGCCCHDLQNALKWSLASLWTGQEIQDLHIVIEALRNSFELLLARLPTFLAQHLAFYPEAFEAETVAGFWRAMGIEAHMVDRLAEVNPWWSEGFLWVNGNLAQDADVVEKVSFVLMYLCKWRRFCEARWVTIGPCCRPLIWCLCVGLETWVSLTRADPSATDYHLHGFARLSPRIKKCCAVAAIAANVVDAVLVEALVDDRLARRADELRRLMMEEVEWVEGIELFTWDRLASVVGPQQTGVELASAAIHASHVQVAFADQKIFRVLASYPWKLAIGDIDANLDLLAVNAGPISDSTTHKIRILLAQGFNRQQLKEGVQLLQEVSWSTVAVEQAHASAACLHKFHPTYEGLMLSTRATLHQCRHLFLTPPEAAAEAKEANRLARLRNKDPYKVSGRHAFLAALMEQGKLALPSGSKLTPAFVRKTVQLHSRWFATLAPEYQAAFHGAAREEAERRAKVLQGDVSHFQDAMRLRKARTAEELQSGGLRNSVTLARLDADDYASMEALRSAGDLPAGKALIAMRLESCSAPEAPPPEVREALQQCPTLAAPVEATEQAPWVKTLCWHRGSIVGTAYSNDFQTGSTAYYFLYATQSPLAAYFLPVIVGVPLLPALEQLSTAEVLEAWGEAHAFLCDRHVQGTVAGHMLPAWGEATVLVVQGFGFQPGGALTSGFAPVPWAEFLATLPALDRGGPGGRGGQRQPAWGPALAEASVVHPWLREFAHRPERPGGDLEPLALQDAEGHAELLLDDLPEDALARVLQDLEDKRKEWAVETIGLGEDFTSILRGGAWTAVHKGLAFDCCAATAKKGLPSQWCRKYGMNQIASYSFSVYGEVTASTLAAEWCRRMQFYYDLWIESGQDYVYRPEDKAAYKPTDSWLRLKADLTLPAKARQRAEIIEDLFPVPTAI